MNRKTLLQISVLLLGVITLSNCHEKEVKNEADQYLGKLSFAWKVQQVMLDGADVTGFYTNLLLTLKPDKTYSVINPVGQVWPTSGSFTLEKINASDYKLMRNDGIEITVTELSDVQLKYTFQYTTPGGRTESVTGRYEFIMKK